MSDEQLVEYQKQAYNEVVAEFTFECSGGGAPAVTSPKLEGLKKGIKLHFFRYGFIDKKSNTDTGTTLETITKNKKEFTIKDVSVQNTTIPGTKNFYLARTFLRPGYIYIIKKDKPGKYKEYEVDSSGKLKSILWTRGNNGDFRNATGSARAFITINEAGEYYIAYSPEQWSRDYFNEMNASDDKKAQQMHCINCIGIPLDSTPETEEVIAYKDIKLVCHADHLQKNEFRTNLKEIHIDEQQQSAKGDNEYYEDMFITLHDPVGCLNDISAGVSEKVLEFKALVEAIQTGESEQEAYNRLKNNGTPASKVDKNYQNLFSLALACYKMVYSSVENTQKYDGGDVSWNFNDTNFPHQEQPTQYQSKSRGMRYKYPPGYVRNEFIGYGLHREKVEGILGKAARKEKREILNSFRDDFGNFLKSDYLNQGLKNYTDNSCEHCLGGVAMLYTSILPFYNNPYNLDRHLLLDKEYEENDDWTKWIIEKIHNDVIAIESSLDTLFVQELPIDDALLQTSVAIDLLNKFAAATAARIEIHTNIPFESKVLAATASRKTRYQKIVVQRHRRIVKSLNKIQISNSKSKEVHKIFKFGNTDLIEMDASKLGAKFDPNLEIVVTDARKQVQTIVADKIKHQRLYGKKSIAAGGNHLLEVGDQVEDISNDLYKINQGNAKRYNQKAAQFLNSRGFTGVLTGLQVLNFSNAVLNIFSKENNSIHDYSKATINAIGISAELTDASLKLRQAHLNAVGNTVSADKLVSKIRLAGAIGGAVTAGMCTWDGILALNKRDVDAGAAWIGAGLAFGVSTAAAVWGTSVFLLSGPVGWIALAIGFGLVALANIFTDSELEYYFKHFLLCDRAHFFLGANETPMDYNRRLFAARKTLVKYEDKDVREKLMNPTDAMASLFDLTVCNTISYRPTSFGPKMGSGHAGYRLIKSYEIQINFNQFLVYGEQAEVVLLLLDDTKKEPGTPSQFYPTTNSMVTPLSSGQKQLKSTVHIPQALSQNKNYWYKVVLAIRIRIDESINCHFPYPLQSTGERYMGVRLTLKRGMHGSPGGTKELQFGSLDQLKKSDLW